MDVKMIDFDGVKPTRAHHNDAGLDCYAETSATLTPGDRTRISLGFGLELPDGYVAFLLPRSSLNAKGIRVEIGTIDSGYRGEIQAVVVNDTDETVTIHANDKIAQLVVLPVTYVNLVDKFDDERGDAGFGSSGK